MDNHNSQRSGGVSFLGLLTLIFITLKLMGYISWSWWWVLSPLLLSLGLAVMIIVLIVIVALYQALKQSRR